MAEPDAPGADDGWTVIPRKDLSERLDEALTGAARREVLVEDEGRLAFVITTVPAWSDLRRRRRTVRVENLSEGERAMFLSAEVGEPAPVPDDSSGGVECRSGRVGGEPCFAGTRVPVDALFVNLAAGHSLGRVLDSYPTLSLEAARAALRRGLALLRREALARSALPPGERTLVGDIMFDQDWDFSRSRLRRVEVPDAEGGERVELRAEGVRYPQTFRRRPSTDTTDAAWFTGDGVPVGAILALMRAGWPDDAIEDAFLSFSVGWSTLQVIRESAHLFGRSLPFVEALTRLRTVLTAHALADGGSYHLRQLGDERPPERPLPALFQGEPVPPHRAQAPADVGMLAYFAPERVEAACKLATAEAGRVGLTLELGECLDGSLVGEPGAGHLGTPDETWGDRL